MFSKAVALSLLVAFANARFGQEQVPIPAISAVQAGAPGEAQTLAGEAVSDLLAAANPCAKLSRGDQILQELGNGIEAVAAAKGIVAAEQNFNPFITDIPNICSDPTLPANPILRGITPLIDPAVLDSIIVNALSKKSLTTPFNTRGKSVADVLRAQGFSNFTAVALDGARVAPGGTSAVSSASSSDKANLIVSAIVAVSKSAAAVITSAASPTATDTVSYGSCNPQMDFVGGRNGRKLTEFTFAPIDSQIGGEEALNPNIITDRTCNQLINVCGANTAGESRCKTCEAQITALGTRNQGTADAWNSCLIAGTDIKQDTTSGLVIGATATETAGAAASAAEAAATATGVNYGLCDPQMDFIAGRPGRTATEFTFLPIDPLTKEGQQDALNPNIITNRICDQLTNVCQSNAAAKAQCQTCKIEIAALGTKNAGTADAWNECVIAGTNIKQDTAFDSASAVDTTAASTVVSSTVTVDLVVSTTAAQAALSTNGAVIVTVMATTTIMSTQTVIGDCSATNVAASTAASAASAGTSSVVKANVQPFTGSLGSQPVPVEQIASSRPFIVEGDSFVGFGAACQRSCDVQHNKCADVANAGGATFTVGDCDKQDTTCAAGCAAGLGARAKRDERRMRARSL